MYLVPICDLRKSADPYCMPDQKTPLLVPREVLARESKNKFLAHAFVVGYNMAVDCYLHKINFFNNIFYNYIISTILFLDEYPEIIFTLAEPVLK